MGHIFGKEGFPCVGLQGICCQWPWRLALVATSDSTEQGSVGGRARLLIVGSTAMRSYEAGSTRASELTGALGDRGGCAPSAASDENNMPVAPSFSPQQSRGKSFLGEERFGLVEHSH